MTVTCNLDSGGWPCCGARLLLAVVMGHAALCLRPETLLAPGRRLAPPTYAHKTHAWSSRGATAATAPATPPVHAGASNDGRHATHIWLHAGEPSETEGRGAANAFVDSDGESGCHGAPETEVTEPPDE